MRLVHSRHAYRGDVQGLVSCHVRRGRTAVRGRHGLRGSSPCDTRSGALLPSTVILSSTIRRRRACCLDRRTRPESRARGPRLSGRALHDRDRRPAVERCVSLGLGEDRFRGCDRTVRAYQPRLLGDLGGVVYEELETENRRALAADRTVTSALELASGLTDCHSCWPASMPSATDLGSVTSSSTVCWYYWPWRPAWRRLAPS